ncbi:hypothetical protein F8274_04895 [Micromonospora sp. AMSO31t]|nr:hypothetical protein F8274_04895 [Micromonospora sp. AMSO31t]
MFNQPWGNPHRWLNRPARERVSRSDQDRNHAVTRVAVFMEFAMVRFPERTTIPLLRRPPTGAYARHPSRGPDSKHGPGSQLLLRHS